MTTAPIFFCMPLIGRSVAKDWQKVCELLDQTLQSVLDQTGNIRVLVACNEVPETRFAADPRLSFVLVEPSHPQTWKQKVGDKARKIRRLVNEVCQLGPCYIVIMDADDLVSNRLAAYIEQTDNRTGYTFQSGYVLNVAARTFRRDNQFPLHCGSCTAFYLGPDDLAPGSAMRTIIERGNHPQYAVRCREAGRPLEKVPFPAAVYIRHHGENVSVARHSVLRFTWFRNFVQRCLPGYIPAEVRAEFNIPDSY